MAEVQSLFGGAIPEQPSVQPVINILEEVLARAKNGEVRAIALVWIDGGDGSHKDWHNGDKMNSQLLGHIADLQHMFHKAWDAL